MRIDGIAESDGIAKVKKRRNRAKVKKAGPRAASPGPGCQLWLNPREGRAREELDVLRRAVDLRARFRLSSSPGFPGPVFPLKSSSRMAVRAREDPLVQVYYSVRKTRLCSGQGVRTAPWATRATYTACPVVCTAPTRTAGWCRAG